MSNRGSSLTSNSTTKESPIVRITGIKASFDYKEIESKKKVKKKKLTCQSCPSYKMFKRRTAFSLTKRLSNPSKEISSLSKCFKEISSFVRILTFKSYSISFNKDSNFLSFEADLMNCFE